MLPILRTHFSWTDARTFREIQLFHRDCLDILRAKSIDYASLRSALTPQQLKHEAAFLFDEQRCQDKYVPGAECADALIRKKLRMSYVYNMEWVDAPTHQLSKFNIMLEFPRAEGHPERLMAALE